jgi:hypothetical protein
MQSTPPPQELVRRAELRRDWPDIVLTNDIRLQDDAAERYPRGRRR